MMHLSGLVGTASIAICAPTKGSQVFGSYPNVKVIQGGAPCDACYWNEDRGYGVECASGCVNMWDIRPERVFAAIIERLRYENDEAYTTQEAAV
jgi:ADP-heptose:LPS heptosyltransferase